MANIKHPIVGDIRPLSVVMPVFNEEETIREIVHRVLELPQLRELIIVNDASTDSTAEILHELAAASSAIKVLSNESNLGKTGSVKLGIRATGGEIVTIQDADLEYDPADIPQLIEPIASGEADVVYGSRYLGHSSRNTPYYSFYLANRVITGLSNLLSGQRLSDVQTCYVAARGDLLRRMIVRSSRFGFEVEAAAKFAKLSITITERPISYEARTYAAGKKLGWVHGFAAVWYIIKYNLLTSADNSFHRPD